MKYVGIYDRRGNLVASTCPVRAAPAKSVLRISPCPGCDVLRAERGPHVCVSDRRKASS